MPPVVNLVAGLVLIPCAFLIGWDALVIGSATHLLLAVLFLGVSALQFVLCARLRSRGCGWKERPRQEHLPRRRSR